MKAIFYNSDTEKWLEFTEMVDMLYAQKSEDVCTLLQKIEMRTKNETLFSAGYITYEASPSFDMHYAVRETPDELPAASFALFRNRKEYSSLVELRQLCASENYSVGVFSPEISHDSYIRKIASIKDYLRRGDTYQINFTFRMNSHFSGNSFKWFLDLAEKKPGNYCCYLENDTFAICSFSPELFFSKKNETLTFKPMKGTAARVSGKDEEECTALKNSEKNRAENLMIVDMIRNDSGKIAKIGSVEVPSLFTIELYPTVIQMTSTIIARTTKGITALFSSLFPCASITGAPKIRSMKIIHELEESGRGVYTGTLGYITPEQDCLFNVAIRTAMIHKQRHTVCYGTGSGIVWGSEAEQEWEECKTKTAILGQLQRFYIFETLLLEDGVFYLLERHLERLERSRYFFCFSELNTDSIHIVRNELERISFLHPQGKYRVRILLDSNYAFESECIPLTDLPTPYTLFLSTVPVDPSDPFIYHKSSCRRHIDAALEASNGASDVILINNRGEITESSRANIVLEIDNTLWTPPLTSGVLPGVYREELLEKGQIHERVLYPVDLEKADKLYIINSVRRMVECLYISPLTTK